ncbi:hypothetical protein KM043_010090 [Ampulex compressa]|nr:hypothetical protein KM043_010090 [Ampulex compressa]
MNVCMRYELYALCIERSGDKDSTMHPDPQRGPQRPAAPCSMRCARGLSLNQCPFLENLPAWSREISAGTRSRMRSRLRKPLRRALRWPKEWGRGLQGRDLADRKMRGGGFLVGLFLGLLRLTRG